MSEETPTTAKVREAYAYESDTSLYSLAEAGAEFDRWLAEHDAKISDSWRSLHRIHQETEAELNEAIYRHGERIKASEAQVAELQAVIEQAKAMAPISASGTFDILYAVPSDVLAAHDAQVKADTLEEAAEYADEIQRISEKPMGTMTKEDWSQWTKTRLMHLNRRQIALWLRARASEVRGTGTPTKEGN